MSSGDGQSLTGREQAILDGLAAKASADDPSLAAALQGRKRSLAAGSLRVRVPASPVWLAHWTVGAVVAVTGWVLTVVGLSTSLLVGVVGAGLAFLGVGRVVTAAPWIPGHSVRDSVAAADD